MPIHNSYIAAAPIPYDYVNWILSVIVDKGIPGFTCTLLNPNNYKPHLTLALACHHEPTFTDPGLLNDQRELSIFLQNNQWHYPNMIDQINQTLPKNMAVVAQRCSKILMVVDDFEILQSPGKQNLLVLRLKNLEISGNGDIRTLNAEVLDAFNFKYEQLENAKLKLSRFSNKDDFKPHITIGTVADPMMQNLMPYLQMNKGLILSELNQRILEISSLELSHYTVPRYGSSEGQYTILFDASLCRSKMQILANFISDCIAESSKKKPEIQIFNVKNIMGLLQKEPRWKQLQDNFPELSELNPANNPRWQKTHLCKIIMELLRGCYGKQKFYLHSDILIQNGETTESMYLLPKDGLPFKSEENYKKYCIECLNYKKTKFHMCDYIICNTFNYILEKTEQDTILLSYSQGYDSIQQDVQQCLGQGLKVFSPLDIANRLSGEINKLSSEVKEDIATYRSHLFGWDDKKEKLEVKTGDLIRYIRYRIEKYPDTYGSFLKLIRNNTNQTLALAYNPKSNRLQARGYATPFNEKSPSPLRGAMGI